jgi:hypothetical protein
MRTPIGWNNYQQNVLNTLKETAHTHMHAHRKLWVVVVAVLVVVEEEDLVRTLAPSLQTQAPCETLQSRLDRVVSRGPVKMLLHRQWEALVAIPALVSKLNSALLCNTYWLSSSRIYHAFCTVTLCINYRFDL